MFPHTKTSSKEWLWRVMCRTCGLGWGALSQSSRLWGLVSLMNFFLMSSNSSILRPSVDIVDLVPIRRGREMHSPTLIA